MITTLINQFVVFKKTEIPARVVAAFVANSKMKLVVVSLDDGQIYQDAADQFRMLPDPPPPYNVQMMDDKQIVQL